MKNNKEGYSGMADGVSAVNHNKEVPSGDKLKNDLENALCME